MSFYTYVLQLKELYSDMILQEIHKPHNRGYQYPLSFKCSFKIREGIKASLKVAKLVVF
jgi:hypothetical protein